MTFSNNPDFQVTLSSTEMFLQKDLLSTLFPTLVSPHKKDPNLKDYQEIEKQCGEDKCLGCTIKQAGDERENRPWQFILHLYSPSRIWRLMCQVSAQNYDSIAERIFEKILESFEPTTLAKK